ncbi:small integral membrane protein 14 isoform X1 [Bactrocera dorsalis]|uniref:Small integral membrane protein 14 n=2 Tax=Bactrocera dorsalis TaxID=27457 RepID=A0ABM3JHQ7_BACDO|nr:small integral membrane protein 14 isoform X1 [Bactrocera dorsalis]
MHLHMYAFKQAIVVQIFGRTKMGDEFDGCECVWSHEYAMQRLLAMIRQSQNHCTDTECVDISGRMRETTTTGNGNEESNFTMVTMFMIFAVLMYLIRPESIMKLTNTKRRSQRQDPNGGLPPPPPPPAPPAVN